MYRLTKRNEQNTAYYYPKCFEKCNGMGASRKCDSCDLVEMVCDKLGEQEDAEEQGLLIRLPWKVGDTIYEITENHIEPCTVETIYLADYKDKDGNYSYIAEIHYDREDCPWVSTEIYFTDIGKTVFLTREEEEAKLEEMRCNNEINR